MPRLFVAVDVSAELEAALWQLSCGVPGARWTPQGQHHLTLRFIGEVGPGEARDVAEALELVKSEPFEMSLKGVGHFPPRGQAKVLWAGVEAPPELNRLQQRVDKALQRAGIPADPRKFHAHVTLARLSGTPQRRVGDYLAEHGLLRLGPFRVDEFRLYSSVLHPEGSRYRVEHTYPLATDA